uniref:toll-like receptor 2 n=2 Tax=Myxine glutinosa TaxID=7769 RepID=UPI00358F94E1
MPTVQDGHAFNVDMNTITGQYMRTTAKGRGSIEVNHICLECTERVLRGAAMCGALCTAHKALLLLLLCLGTDGAPCTIQGQTADCSGLYLQSVTADLPTNITFLDLSSNLLRRLVAGALRGLPNLLNLDLHYNMIEQIHPQVFFDVPQLHILDLFYNRLKTIPVAALAPLHNLVSLNLSDNLYPTISLEPGLEDTLQGLHSLWLGGPRVMKLNSQDLVPLKLTAIVEFTIKTGLGFSWCDEGAMAPLATLSPLESLTLDMDFGACPQCLSRIFQDLSGITIGTLKMRRTFAIRPYMGPLDVFAGLHKVQLSSLILYRGKYTDRLVDQVLRNIQNTSLETLELSKIDFAYSENGMTNSTWLTGDLPLKMLVFHDISNPDVLRYNKKFDWYQNLDVLVINNVNFNIVPCEAWYNADRLSKIDLSGNRLQDQMFYNGICSKHRNVTKLKTVVIENNELTSLEIMAKFTMQWQSLETVVLSHNRFSGAVNGHRKCEWSQSITHIDLQSNPLSRDVFKCLPTTLRYLDMSHSGLEYLHLAYFKAATKLEHLFLSGNKIKFLPSGWQAPSLLQLAVDDNAFGLINPGTFKEMPHLQSLQAGGNPYHCNCDMWAFLQEVMTRSEIKLLGWPHNYTCYHPQPQRGTDLAKFRPGRLQCDVALLVGIAVAITTVVVVTLMALCWKFDVPWYLRTTWNMLDSRRRKARKNDVGRQFHYDAFISYSNSDASWVYDELLPRIETRHCICVHERDFTPGCWIIDNIMNSLENSRKVLFVVSRSFVNSQWCNFELYFAHQCSPGNAFNDLVLLLKERIDTESLPHRFCKLRKLLSRRTYLEWPTEKSKQMLFWQQLKNLLD